MTGTYPDEASALRRVETLKHAGIWPRVIRHPDGSASLTHDPDSRAGGQS